MSEGDTESFMPPVTGKGRRGFLPATMDGVKMQTVAPYGGMTGEEWYESQSKPTTMQDKRPTTDPEILGTSILRLTKEGNMSASDAADMILGT